jgi:sugar O-acyltransferase (sialic acid O-acetyltransferase NeuD family)
VRVVIVGARRFARRMYVYLSQDGGRDVAAFAVPREYLDEAEILGLEVVALEELEDRFDPAGHEACVAVGYVRTNRVRAELCAELEGRGYGLTAYRSSRATVWGEVAARHTLVLDDAVVGPFAKVGEDVILNGANVNHDAVVEDHCFIGTGATVGGEATVGAYSFVGLNATIRNEVTIAPRCVIGAGAVIKRDTQEGEVYSAGAAEPIRLRSWELRDPY